MMETIAVAARFAQFAAAMIILGAPFFFLRTFRDDPAPGWARAWLWGATALLVAGGAASAMAQAALMFGDPAAAMRPPDIASVMVDTQVGRGLTARLALTLLFAILLASRMPDRATWAGGVLIGTLIAASFAWTGHGAATEGPGGELHLLSDIAHTVGAAVWLGALVPLLMLVVRGRRRTATVAERQLVHDSLEGFSGVGTIAVALLIVTGVVNSWFLIGPDKIGAVADSLYGQLLLAKLGLFGLMLALASANRFWLTPALHRALAGKSDVPLGALRTSVLVETLAGLLILGAVSVLGTLAPVSAT